MTPQALSVKAFPNAVSTLRFKDYSVLLLTGGISSPELIISGSLSSVIVSLCPKPSVHYLYY